MRGGNAGGIHHCGGIVGHGGSVVGPAGCVRAADTAVVEGDDPVAAGEFGDLQAPGLQRAAQPHDQQQRFAGAEAFVPKADITVAGVRHRGKLAGEWPGSISQNPAMTGGSASGAAVLLPRPPMSTTPTRIRGSSAMGIGDILAPHEMP